MFSPICSQLLCDFVIRLLRPKVSLKSALTLHSSRRATTHPPHNLMPSLQPPQRKLQETGREKHLQSQKKKKSQDQLKLMQLDEPGSPYPSSLPEPPPPLRVTEKEQRMNGPLYYSVPCAVKQQHQAHSAAFTAFINRL